MHAQLVVIGGGPGGYAAAFLAADLGMEVILVDAEERLGGVCLLRGCIPSKALLHVAKVLTEAREADQWGIHFERPIIDLDTLRRRKDKVIETLTGGLAQLAKQRKVRHIRARAAFEDSQTLILQPSGDSQLEDPRLTFDHCILAVGSSPSAIPALSLKSNRVMDSTSALALPEIPESLLVIGGGYIGLEMGTVYAELGSQVTVIELTGGLLPGVDRDLVRPLAARLEKLFVGIHLNSKVTALAESASAVNVTFEGPDGKKSQGFSRVLVSVGRKPNTRDIGLENTAVELNEHGYVIVDNRQRTTDPRILAIGDVTGEPMLAHKASHEGKVAVESLHGGPAVFEPLAIPAVVFTDPEIAWAGLTEEQAKKQDLHVDVIRYPWAASGRAQSLLRTEGLTKLVIDPETERILGVGLVGAGAGELIAEGVLAIEMGATARDLSDSIHPHPTLSETLSFAGEAFYGLATEIYRPRRP
jgi:dihydrolipoamide dehydrogenase